VSIIPVGIVANWFYYKNNRSIPAAILFHAMLNAAGVLIAAGPVAKVIATLLYAAIAVGLIIGDRRLFGEGPRNFLKADSAPSSRPEQRCPFADLRFGAILILPPRLAEADRRNNAKVWSCLNRRRCPADRRLALVEGRSDERGQIGDAARDGQEVLADR
jgi:hypothetical protein